MLKALDASGELAEYPNRHFLQIDKDLDRTYPQDAFFTDEIKKSIRSVCRAYVWRNPRVGYSQGMNYLVFRLRKQLSEEDTFWVLALLVECYLPPDFYSSFNARVQYHILLSLLEEYKLFSKGIRKLNEV